MFLVVFFPSAQLLWAELSSVLATGLGSNGLASRCFWVPGAGGGGLFPFPGPVQTATKVLRSIESWDGSSAGGRGCPKDGPLPQE